MKRTLLLIGAMVSVVALAACGSKATTNPSATGTFNDADVTFVQQMIPHHRQAIEMADIALTAKAGAGAKVKDIATRIKSAQDPEITMMNGFLGAWGKSSAATTSAADNGMPGMDHAMNGMMTADEMTKLGQQTGADFDKSWMTSMTAHHQGAIEMANTVTRAGKSVDVKTLAAAIIKGQQAEIDEMTALLKG